LCVAYNYRHPTSGSFVRFEKLNLGRSVPAAVRDRYGEVKNDVTAGINKEELSLLKCKMNAPFLEVIGFDKVNKMQRSVHHEMLDTVGDQFCYNETLEYSHNKLPECSVKNLIITE
jgi:hypothetical protein